MAISDYPKIQRIILEGYEFKMGVYIEKGMDLFKKNMGNYVGFAVVGGLILILANIIPIIGPIVSSLILTPVLTAGFYKTSREVESGKQPPFAHFFSAFDQIGTYVVLQIITTLVIICSMIPFLVSIFFSGFLNWYIDLLSNPDGIYDFPGFPFWSVILLIPTFYLSIAYQFSIPLVAFHKMGFWDAMEASRQIVSKRWIWFFLFYIVVGTLAMLGIIGLFIGLLFTIPAAFCFHYACFSEITQLEEPDEEGLDIGDHLIV